MTRSTTLLAAITLLAASLGADGCFNQGLNSWEKARLEARTSDDIGGQLDGFGSFSGGLADLDTQRGTWEDCVVGYGGCDRCYVLDGTSQSGTASMELVIPPGGTSCTAALTLNDVRYEYTVTERQWSGEWELLSGTPGDDALWSVDWVGNHDATLIVTGSDSYDGTYDSSFVMNAASGVTDGDGELSEWSVNYDYSGFLERDWTVTASMDAAQAITGSVVSTDGITCAISGVQYDVVVDCE